MNWQPIETAPKNEDVLVFTGDRIYTALFVDDATDPFHETGRGGSDFDGLWTVDDNKHGPYALRGARPTHWMPLPAAPGEECLTCSGHGAVGNILTAEPCPECTPAAVLEVPAAPETAPVGDGLRVQHDRDSAELRRLCQARDEARRERDLDRAEIAGLQASTGHLSALVDGQHALLEKAKATMTALHGSASPIDESGGDFDARIPASAFARFVDEHAALLHAMAQSPAAAPAATVAAKESP